MARPEMVSHTGYAHSVIHRPRRVWLGHSHYPTGGEDRTSIQNGFSDNILTVGKPGADMGMPVPPFVGERGSEDRVRARARAQPDPSPGEGTPQRIVGFSAHSRNPAGSVRLWAEGAIKDLPRRVHQVYCENTGRAGRSGV